MKNVAATLVLVLAVGAHHAEAQGRAVGTIQEAGRANVMPSASAAGGRSWNYTEPAPRAAVEHLSNSNVSAADNYGGRSSNVQAPPPIAEARTASSGMELASSPSYSSPARSGSGYRSTSGGGGGGQLPQYAPYFSCEQSRGRSLAHCDSVRIHCSPIPQFVAQPPWCYGPYYYAYAVAYNREVPLRDEPARPMEHSMSVLFKSFDGYIIYGNDTISGKITMDKRSAFIKPYSYEKYWNVNYQLNDPALLKIGLFYDATSLYYARVPGHAKVQRVVHSGKLSIYDSKFDFLSAGNINRNSIVVAIADNRVGTVHLSRKASRHDLVDKINAAYGLSIKAQDYTWPRLLSFIDQLN